MTDPQIITPQPDPELTRSQQRITQLSEKVETTAKERDDAQKLAKDTAEKLAAMEKENTFNAGFADIIGTHPAAKDHRDEIKTKVLAGYTPQDATFAVLGAVGKLGGPPTVPTGTPPPVAGGPAAVNQPPVAVKSVQEMTLAEKREVLSKELLLS